MIYSFRPQILMEVILKKGVLETEEKIQASGKIVMTLEVVMRKKFVNLFAEVLPREIQNQSIISLD
jgi:hypothetical protein